MARGGCVVHSARVRRPVSAPRVCALPADGRPDTDSTDRSATPMMRSDETAAALRHLRSVRESAIAPGAKKPAARLLHPRDASLLSRWAKHVDATSAMPPDLTVRYAVQTLSGRATTFFVH